MKSKKRDEAYNIRRIYEQMELDLIASMKRNLKKHMAEEDKVGFKFEQWQNAKLRDIERYKRENKAILAKYESKINNSIVLNLISIYRRAQDAVNRFIKRIRNKYVEDVFVKLPGDLQPILTATENKELEPIKEVIESAIENAKVWQEAPRPNDDVFFRSNDEKFNALLETVESDFKNANAAVLRRVEDVYRQTIFKAQVHYNQGAVSLDKAVDMATKDFLDKGIDAITYKDGKKVNITSYAEMALRTANHRSYLMGEGKKRQEIGMPFVVVSAHATSCKLCIPWQGLILIDDVYSGGKKEDGPYPLLSEAIEKGFLHPNCRHNLSTYFPGITTLPKIPDANKVLENYEQEQKQRVLERAIRKQKRRIAGTVDKDNLKIEKEKLSELQQEMRNHLGENPQLRRDYRREKPGSGISNKDLKTHENVLNKIEIDSKIKEIKEYIKSDACNKSILDGRQGKHISGHNNYKQEQKRLERLGQYGPGYITIEAEEIQKLVDRYHGTGEIRLTSKMEWDKKETILENDMIVGKVIDNRSGNSSDTNVFKIHYSDKGVHIVPDYPSKKKGR